jgi:hypothetical protein
MNRDQHESNSDSLFIFLVILQLPAINVKTMFCLLSTFTPNPLTRRPREINLLFCDQGGKKKMQKKRKRKESERVVKGD